jgi:hypothetical protein
MAGLFRLGWLSACLAAALAVVAAALARVLLAGVAIETKDAALWR